MASAAVGQVTDSEGNKTCQPLPIDGLHRSANKDDHRWYHTTTVPCDTNGDHPLRIPLLADDADRDKGFLRSEYLRQLPPDTRGYERTYGTRPSAESDNAQREGRFTWHSLPAYGTDGQALTMLNWNFLENSKALYVHRQRQQQAA